MKNEKMCLPFNLTAFSFFLYWKCPTENGGVHPWDPACLEHFLCSNFSSLAETFQISHFASEIVSISSWQLSQLPLCEFTGFALVTYL